MKERMKSTSLTPTTFNENRLKGSDVENMCLEIIERFEPCTEEEIIECFDYRKRVSNIKNTLTYLEREKKIYFLPRTKTFCIRRDQE
jgi:hypothetical protein